MVGERPIATFLVLWAAWILLTDSLDLQEILVGAAASAIVAGLSSTIFLKKSPRDNVQGERFTNAILYLPAYIWAEIKAHTKVIYLILHPRMPIRPGIVKVPTGLRTDMGITGLANAITMTPGTLSVEVDEGEPSLFVHWIDVVATEPKRTSEEIGKPFERYLEKVFG